MQKYKFPVGAYMLHTSHLNHLEDLALRRLLDYCQMHETRLPASPATCARLVRMHDQVGMIKQILQEFFYRSRKNGSWTPADFLVA